VDLFDTETFHRYYRNSWIINPVTGTVAQIRSVKGEEVLLTDGKNNMSVPRKDLDWSHVRTPELGYRTHPSKHYVMYAERVPGRTVTKGFNDGNIRISIPECCRASYAAITDTHINEHIQITSTVAKEIFHPSFLRLEEAIANLAKNPKATGYALSPSWALCLGPAGADYMLLFKGVLVAASTTGADWQWLDSVAEELFNNSSVR